MVVMDRCPKNRGLRRGGFAARLYAQAHRTRQAVSSLRATILSHEGEIGKTRTAFLPLHSLRMLANRPGKR